MEGAVAVEEGVQGEEEEQGVEEDEVEQNKIGQNSHQASLTGQQNRLTSTPCLFRFFIFLLVLKFYP